jgi:hypothetical protein
MILIKKLSVCFLLAGLLFNFAGINQAGAVDMRGKISFYKSSDVGKIGFHGKAIGPNDCAVDDSKAYTIPKGTAMVTKNLDNGKVHTFYKWDIGNFPSGVVLDIIPADFTGKLGGSLSKGHINGNVTYFL